MAYTHHTPFGAIIELDNTEVNNISAILSNTTSGAIAVASMLTATGISGPAETVASAIHAIFGIGDALLNACNSNNNGIFLYVF
jgi:hypothetical protein